MENEPQSTSTQHTGFAQLHAPLLSIWHLLPHHHQTLLPIILSYMPNAWPSQSTLAERIHRSRRTVVETIGQLKDHGILLVIPRLNEKNGSKMTNQYYLANLEDEAVVRKIGESYAPVNCKTSHTPPCEPLGFTSHMNTLGSHGMCSQGIPMPSAALRLTLKDNATDKKRNNLKKPAADAVALTGRGSRTVGHSLLMKGREEASIHQEIVSPPERDQPITSSPPERDQAEASIRPGIKSTPEREQPKARHGQKLTDEDKVAITASLDSMLNWLRYHTIGAAKSAPAEAAPADTHWHKLTPSDEQQIDPNATPAQLAGLWWAMVSRHRAAAGQPLSIPDIVKITRSLKPHQAVLTQDQLVNLMKTVVGRWPEIKHSLSWAKPPLELRENTMSFPPIISTVEQMTNPSPADVNTASDIASAIASSPTLSDDELKNRICSSIEKMNRYLCWGKEALDVDKSVVISMKRTPTCFWRDTDETYDHWKASNFAGLYWSKVSQYRVDHGIPLTMPDIGQICGRIARMLDWNGRAMTKHQLYEHCVWLPHFFELIKLMAPGISLSLTEGTIDHKLCLEKLAVLHQMSDEQRADFWVKLSNKQAASEEENDEYT